MTATTRWVIDTAWSAVSFSTGDVNSLASGGGALATAAITNSSNLDQFMDVSFSVEPGSTTIAGGFISLYLLPLNQDGSTYGDGYASNTGAQPVVNYQVGACQVRAGIAAGGTAVGIFSGVLLPPGDFKLALGNNLGVALNSAATLTIKYRTYNDNLNA